MTTPTTATITIEIEVPVSGTWVRAEPDVGIFESWFEDARIDFPSPKSVFAFPPISVKQKDALDDVYADDIQEALAEARADDNARPDDRRDEAYDKGNRR